jgi:hypothetical protein
MYITVFLTCCWSALLCRTDTVQCISPAVGPLHSAHCRTGTVLCASLTSGPLYSAGQALHCVSYQLLVHFTMQDRHYTVCLANCWSAVHCRTDNILCVSPAAGPLCSAGQALYCVYYKLLIRCTSQNRHYTVLCVSPTVGPLYGEGQALYSVSYQLLVHCTLQNRQYTVCLTYCWSAVQ